MFDKVTLKTIIDVADKYDYEAAAILAIIETESNGMPFATVNGKQKPIVRYEGHYFYARLNDADRAKAVEQGLASPKVGGIANPTSFAGRYKLIERASAINASAALESVSWGLGQVMGANWQALGYSSVQDLVKASETLEGQIDMIVRFLEDADLRDEISQHDWKAIAKAYNGASYKKNKYDVKLAEAYARYKNIDIENMTDTQVDFPTKDEIIYIQKMLNSVGAYGLEEDGIIGDKTKVAIKDFQLKNSLKVDGMYGPITKSELEKAYLAKSNKATQNVGIAASSVSTIGTVVSEAAKQIEPLAKISQIAQWVFLGLLVVGVLITLKVTLFSGDKK